MYQKIFKNSKYMINTHLKIIMIGSIIKYISTRMNKKNILINQYMYPMIKTSLNILNSNLLRLNLKQVGIKLNILVILNI